MLREDVVDYLRRYAASINAPVQTDTDVTRVSEWLPDLRHASKTRNSRGMDHHEHQR